MAVGVDQVHAVEAQAHFSRPAARCGLLDALVVVRIGLDEAAGGLQVEDLLVGRFRRVEGEEGLLDLFGQGRVEVAAHGPVVVVVGRRGGEDLDLGGIDLAAVHQLLPDRGVQHAGVDLAGLDPGYGGVVGAGVGDAGEELLGDDAVLLHEVARHQAARGGGDRAEGEGLALQVLQGFHLGIGRDEFAGELLVLLALHQGDGVAGLQPRLDEGEAAQPGHVQAVGGQRLDHPGVVGYRDELHRHAELLLQIGAERLEFAQQLGGRLVGDRRDLEFFQGFGVGERGGQGQGDAGGERQGAFQHGRVLRFNGGKTRGV